MTKWQEIPEDIEAVAKYLAENDGYTWAILPNEQAPGTISKLSKEYWRRLSSGAIALADSID